MEQLLQELKESLNKQIKQNHQDVRRRDEFLSESDILAESIYDKSDLLEAEMHAFRKVLNIVNVLEEKHKARLDFARAAVRLAEKINIGESVRYTLLADTKTPPAIPSSFVPQEDMYIHCRTEEEAETLLKHLHGLGFSWCSYKSLLELSCFNFHKRKTCYGVYPDKKYVTYTSRENVYESRPVIAFENITAYMELQKCDSKENREYDVDAKEERE